jgi:hypothetical protein
MSIQTRTSHPQTNLQTAIAPQVFYHPYMPYHDHLLDCQELTFTSTHNHFVPIKIYVIGNFGLLSDNVTQVVYQNHDLFFYSPVIKIHEIALKLLNSNLAIISKLTTSKIHNALYRVQLPTFESLRQIKFTISSDAHDADFDSDRFLLAPIILKEHKITWFLKKGNTLSLDKQAKLIHDKSFKYFLSDNKISSEVSQNHLNQLHAELAAVKFGRAIIIDRIAEWLKNDRPAHSDKQFNNALFSHLLVKKCPLNFSCDYLPTEIAKYAARRAVTFSGLYITSIPLGIRPEQDPEKALLMSVFREAWENSSASPLQQEFKRALFSGDVITLSSILKEQTRENFTPIYNLLNSKSNPELRDGLFSPIVMKGLIENISLMVGAPIRTIFDSYGNFLSRALGAFLVPDVTLYVTCEQEQSLLSMYMNMQRYLQANAPGKNFCALPESIEKVNIREQYDSSMRNFGGVIEYPRNGFDLAFVSPPPLRLFLENCDPKFFEKNLLEAVHRFIELHIKKCWNEVRENGFLMIYTPVYYKNKQTFNIAKDLIKKINKELPDSIFHAIIPLYSGEDDKEKFTPIPDETYPYGYILLLQKEPKRYISALATDAFSEERDQPAGLLHCMLPQTPPSPSDDDIRAVRAFQTATFSESVALRRPVLEASLPVGPMLPIEPEE